MVAIVAHKNEPRLVNRASLGSFARNYGWQISPSTAVERRGGRIAVGRRRAGEVTAVRRGIVVERRSADSRAAAVNAVAGTVTRICRGRIRVGRGAWRVGGVAGIGVGVAARIARRVRRVLRIRVGGGRAAIIAAHVLSVGGNGSGQHHGGQEEVFQSFHGFDFVVCFRRRFV